MSDLEERLAETRGLVRDLTTCLKKRNAEIRSLEIEVTNAMNRLVGFKEEIATKDKEIERLTKFIRDINPRHVVGDRGGEM